MSMNNKINIIVKIFNDGNLEYNKGLGLLMVNVECGNDCAHFRDGNKILFRHNV